MNGTPFQPTDDFTFVDLSDFDQLVLPHVPGVQRPLYELERISVLREFCRKSSALIGLHPALNIVEGKVQYNLDGVPPDLAVLSLRQVFNEDDVLVNGRAYLLSADRQTLSLQDGWENSFDGQQLYPLLSLQICRDAERVESEFFNRWDEGIAAGIIERLMTSPNKAWTNIQAAPIFSHKYHNTVVEARIAVSREFGNTAPRTVLGGFE